MAGLLQDNGDNDKSTSVPGMPITHRRLGFDDNEGIDTGSFTGGDVGIFSSDVFQPKTGCLI